MVFVEKETQSEVYEEDNFVSSFKAPVECICPKCRQRHIMQFFWTGEFTPWKYCKSCKNIVA